MGFNPDAYLAEGSSSGFDPDAYLGVKKQEPTLVDQIPGILKQAATAALDSSPAKLTQKFMQTDPATMQKVGGPALPIAGGALGGPVGAAAGELLRQATGTAFAPETVPETPLGRAASAASAGILQEPKILNAIPGVSQATGKVSQLMSGLAAKAGKGFLKAGETASGVKAQDLGQAAEQGLSTYGAPSLKKATQIFGDALGPEGQAALKEKASDAFDPALGKARAIAADIGSRMEEGKPVSAIEALQARQATDRIISSTSVTDKLTRKSLYDWRSKFDDILTKQDGPLKAASNTYRQAIVKDKILNPTRLNKSGEPSAFLPMLVGHGMMGKGLESGLGMLTGTSPALWGLAATAGGSGIRGLNTLAQNPAIRQTLLQVLQRLNQNKQPEQAKP